MKVSELIAFLQKCNPDSDVMAAYKGSGLTDGDSITGVVEIVYHSDGFANTVTLIM